MKSFFASAAIAAIAVAADDDIIATMNQCLSEGMKWDWDKDVCITKEKDCVENQGGIWQKGTWGGMMTCYMGTPADDCMTKQKYWDWESEKCYETQEELTIIERAREAARCQADGGVWRTLREGNSVMYCYRNEPDQNCDIQGGAFDWVGEKCYDTWDELQVVERKREEDRCVADGHVWGPISEGNTRMQCWTGEPSQDCYSGGGRWTDDKCMTREEDNIYWCEEFGAGTWDENMYAGGFGGCDYSSDVEEASEPVVPVVVKAVAKQASLASKKSKAAASSNAGMYAGISFGVIGLVAAGAMFAAATKKQVSDNEFCLL